MKNEANFKTENPHGNRNNQAKNFFMESKANFENAGKPSFLLPLICKNKPNCEHLDVNITVCKKKVYKDFSRKIYQKNKPKTNPKQTQNKPKTNPIKPNFLAESWFHNNYKLTTKN